MRRHYEPCTNFRRQIQNKRTLLAANFGAQRTILAASRMTVCVLLFDREERVGWADCCLLKLLIANARYEYVSRSQGFLVRRRRCSGRSVSRRLSVGS